MPLVDDIRAALNTEPVSYEAILALIADAPTAERREACTSLRELIQQCVALKPGQPAALLTALLEGEFEWSAFAVGEKENTMGQL